MSTTDDDVPAGPFKPRPKSEPTAWRTEHELEFLARLGKGAFVSPPRMPRYQLLRNYAASLDRRAEWPETVDPVAVRQAVQLLLTAL